MIEVKVGQTWRDKDKRSPFPVVVTAVTETHVRYIRFGRTVQSMNKRFVKAFKLEPHA